MYRERLLTKGTLMLDGNSDLRFATPGMAEFVIGAARSEGISFNRRRRPSQIG